MIILDVIFDIFLCLFVGVITPQQNNNSSDLIPGMIIGEETANLTHLTEEQVQDAEFFGSLLQNHNHDDWD